MFYGATGQLSRIEYRIPGSATVWDSSYIVAPFHRNPCHPLSFWPIPQPDVKLPLAKPSDMETLVISS
jgi:hypothetical protein